MRILFVSNFYPPSHHGGYGLFCEQTAQSLCKRGHVVHVLASGAGDESIHETSYQVHRTLQYDPTLGSTHVHTHNFEVILDKARLWKPDVALVWNTFGLSHEAVFSALSAVPTSAYLMLLDLAQYGPDSLRDRTLLAASQVIRFHFLTRSFERRAVRLLYPGVETLERPSSLPPASGDRLRVIFCGRIVGYKGLHVAIRAMLDLPERYTLTVFGQPDGDSVDYAKEIEQMVITEGLSSRVQLAGWVSRERLIQEYQKHDLVVFPSMWEEPLGLVVLEAMAAGIPVVASRLGAPVELISHGKTGLLFSPGDAHDLAVTMVQLDDEDLRRSMGDAAQAAVKERFSMERFLTDLEKELGRIVREN
jgi:glycosyltransferase involved in cell wall biosynthesis